jgi:hypothetical protein
MLFVWVEITLIVLYAAVACWLIASSDSLSFKMIREDSAITIPASIQEKKTVFCLALRVLGVVFSVQGIALLGRVVGAMVFDRVGYAWASMQWSPVLEMIAYLGVGAYLLFGAANKDESNMPQATGGSGDD